MSQLLSVKDSWRGHATFYVTTTQVLKSNLEKLGKVYIVGECNRQNPFRVICVFFRCINAAWRERPNVVVSTGAAVGCIMCFLGKLWGAKVIWIDSITNVDRISLSGRMVRYIADLFLVQWYELTQKYSGVEYVGTTI
jgi:UDP-N-acetylglucosamine:LPS N-acetylglucosamine transferase